MKQDRVCLVQKFSDLLEWENYLNDWRKYKNKMFFSISFHLAIKKRSNGETLPYFLPVLSGLLWGQLNNCHSFVCGEGSGIAMIWRKNIFCFFQHSGKHHFGWRWVVSATSLSCLYIVAERILQCFKGSQDPDILKCMKLLHYHLLFHKWLLSFLHSTSGNEICNGFCVWGGGWVYTHMFLYIHINIRISSMHNKLYKKFYIVHFFSFKNYVGLPNSIRITP